eukprot:SAG31_NODE_1891_length_6975_cov_11.419430_4_plen_67_part_00
MAEVGVQIDGIVSQSNCLTCCPQMTMIEDAMSAQIKVHYASSRPQLSRAHSATVCLAGFAKSDQET